MRSLLVRDHGRLALCAALILLSGCGQPVREDRSVAWSPNGKQAGFQHADQGVYITRGDDRQPERIFTPEPGTLATSTPLWDRAGRRLIFLTAIDPNRRPETARPPAPLIPEGRVVRTGPVTYTCWLYEPSANERAKPEKLFEAPCDHLGSVAANLAVRWDPNGERLVFIRQAGPRSELRLFHLKSRKESPLPLPAATAAVFDWSPDGRHLACVLGGTAEPTRDEGIWVGHPDATWWHVPNSATFSVGELPSLIESLRASSPCWTADGSAFAFASTEAGAKPDTQIHRLRRAVVATRSVSNIAEGESPFRDLHWTPDGRTLGCVMAAQEPTLRLVEPGKPLSEPLNYQPVRQFVGWNAVGTRLAYTSPARVPDQDEDAYSTLLFAVARARDTLVVADARGGNETALVTGLRVTFPRWSPVENRLSAWLTYSPTYRSLPAAVADGLTRFLGGDSIGLGRGDPAAVVDAAEKDPARAVRWLTVDGQELAQVGHWHLLRRRYDEAWRWYQQVRDAAAPPADAVGGDALAPRDPAFFEWYCLTKLGRRAEAAKKLDAFYAGQRAAFSRLAAVDLTAQAPTLRPSTVITLALIGAGNRGHADEWKRDMGDPNGVVQTGFTDLYQAEVFLSLGAGAEGEAFFREQAAAAPTAQARLIHHIVLANLLLVRHRDSAYAELATSALLPAFAAGMTWQADRPAAPPEEPAELLAMANLMTLAPLGAHGFLERLADSQLRQMRARWVELGDKGTPSGRRFAFALVTAADRRVGRPLDDELVKRWFPGENVAAETENHSLNSWLADFRQRFRGLGEEQ